MNTKRTLFWSVFVIILALIVWGLIAAMNKAPGTMSTVGVPAPVTSSDHILGNSTAPVTIIEYGDFECPACETYFYIMERIYNESSSTMRLIFRHFPLSQHVNAIPAALASEAAGDQGKFWDMYSVLYSKQNDWSEKPTPEAKVMFEGYAKDLGLDMTEFVADENSSSTMAKVQAETDEGAGVGIDHTPTFFVNGKEASPNTYADFKAIIDAAATSTAQ